MESNFSQRVKDVITYSREEALRLGHDFIGTEHLMLGLLRDGNGKAITSLTLGEKLSSITNCLSALKIIKHL
jgi:ATP-dependent Clp protease ATP-binding subunit ClpC